MWKDYRNKEQKEYDKWRDNVIQKELIKEEKEHSKETCGCPCRDPNQFTTCMGICFYKGTCPSPKEKK